MATPLTQEQLDIQALGQRTSAGQIAQDDGTTGVQNPPLPTTAEGRVTNVETANQDLLNSQYVATNGGTGDTLSSTTSQATPPSSTPVFTAAQVNQNLANSGTNGAVSNAPTQAGASAPRDDNTGPNSNATQQIINSSFNQTIVPQPNVLDAYPSYTYGLSWYLLTPQQYTDFQSGARNTAVWSLLAQTGGASQIGRNQFFQLDYYIDNLTIDSLVPLKGSGMAHSATAIDFTVTEPNGLTLIKNLFDAVTNLYKQANVPANPPNYLMAMYCMVIRFYGYDDQGNLQYPIRGQGLTGYPNLVSDTKAVVEKFYPFIIENLQFRVANKVIEYQVKGKPQGQYTALSQDRGSIPFQFELAGETVQDVLVGKPVGTQYVTTDPGARTDAPAPQTSAPTPQTSAPTASVSDITVNAGVNAQGNFTGETENPFAVVAP